MPTLEVIQDLPRLRQIEPAWAALAEAVPSSTPFQLPPWQLTWWHHFGSGQLRVFSWWEETLLIAIIPCFRHHWEGRRQLTLIGSGISDYLEPLLHPSHANSILPQLQRYLQSSADWDICNWQDLAVNTPLHLLKGSLLEDTICSEVPLTGNFEDFWQARPKDMRRNLRRYSERARSVAPITFETTTSADEELLDALICLHAARWEKRGESGMIAANNSSDFLRDIARQFASRNMLRFFTIRFGEKVVALVLTFPYRETIYSYMSALDPDHEILGFGRTLLYEAIRHSYQYGYRAWNFCRGDEHYKFAWGAKPIEKRRLILTRDTASSSPPPFGS